VAEAYRRIYERELQARLPGVRIRFVAAPCGAGAVVTSRGDVVTPLAVRDRRSDFDTLIAAAPAVSDLEAIAQDLDDTSSPALIVSALCVHGDTAADHPAAARVIGSARMVSVRGAASLDDLGDFPACRASLVPDPLTLLGRLTAPRLAQRRIEYLRAMDRYPLTDIVIVEVATGRVAHLPELGRSVQAAIAAGYRITTVALPMSGETMTGDLRRTVERSLVPGYYIEDICLDDLVAVIASCAAIVPLSAALLAAGAAFGRPCVRPPEGAGSDASVCMPFPGAEGLIHDDLRSALQAVPDPPAASPWCAQLDAHFDDVAVKVFSDPAGLSDSDSAESGVAQSEYTWEAARRRLADERLRFAEQTETWRAEIARLKSEVARLTARETALRQEMADVSAHARHEVQRSDLWHDTSSRLELENARLREEHARLSSAQASLTEQAQASARDYATAAKRLEVLERENECLREEHAQLSSAHASLTEQAQTSARDYATAAKRLEVLSRENADLICEVERLHGAIQRFERSKSWRYLAPARAAGRLVRRLTGVRQ
jgi:hypothetical protein